jgi:hypothetical protein
LYRSDYKKKTLFIINDSNRIFSNGASANHSGRPTTEKTCTSVHQSMPIYYLQHRLAATTRLTLQETSVDLRLQRPNQRHQTTSYSHPQTYHSQYRLVVPPSKGSASANVILLNASDRASIGTIHSTIALNH